MEDRASVFMYYGTTHHLYIVVSRSANHVHTLTCINLYSRPPKKKKERKNILPNSVLIITAKRFQAFRACGVILYAVYFNY